MAPLKPIAVGSKYSRLTVIGVAEPQESKRYGISYKESMSTCLCDCGTIKAVKNALLRCGKTESCGCLKLEAIQKRSTHGHRRLGQRSAEYEAWNNMRRRTSNPKSSYYEYYGGRGIKVCERWKASFANFLEDMREKPSPQHSLDRIDVNGNYCPENCRWATKKEQARNCRNSVYITCKGETRTLAEWAEVTGIRRETISNRIKAGWSIEESLTKERSQRNSLTRVRPSS